MLNTKELMKCQCGIYTSSYTTVDNHGLLEMRGETRWLGESVSTGWPSELVMNASDERQRCSECHTESLHAAWSYWNRQHVMRGSLSMSSTSQVRTKIQLLSGAWNAKVVEESLQTRLEEIATAFLAMLALELNIDPLCDWLTCRWTDKLTNKF